jgi:hypothetical protein
MGQPDGAKRGKYPQPRRDETGNEVSVIKTTLELQTRKLTEIRI